jgi:hypothetical protein
MEYQLVTAKSAKDLADRVRQAISDGWEPQGGIAIGVDALNMYFAQAMIKPRK